MSKNSVESCRKYTQRTQKRPKCLWRGPHMGDPFSQHWWVVDEIELSSATGKYIICGAG